MSDFRITSSVGHSDDVLLYAVIADSCDACVRGIAAARTQVTHAGGAAIFSPPTKMSVGDKWRSSGTAVIPAKEAA